MDDKPTLEARKRIEALLESRELASWSSETLRQIRGIQVLEQIGSAKAQELIEMLSRGIPEARLTQEARAARTRFERPR